jgi:hypothetical protein
MKVSDVDMEKKTDNSSFDTAIFPLKNDKLIYDQS